MDIRSCILIQTFNIRKYPGQTYLYSTGPKGQVVFIIKIPTTTIYNYRQTGNSSEKTSDSTNYIYLPDPGYL